MVARKTRPEPEPVQRQPFAWKHFLAIVLGVAAIIGTVCAIATIGGKQEAVFSFEDSATAAARLV